MQRGSRVSRLAMLWVLATLLSCAPEPDPNSAGRQAKLHCKKYFQCYADARETYGNEAECVAKIKNGIESFNRTHDAECNAAIFKLNECDGQSACDDEARCSYLKKQAEEACPQVLPSDMCMSLVSDTPCTRCLNSNCCSERLSCYIDGTPCAELVLCLADCLDNTACTAACQRRFSSGIELYNEVADCVSADCSAACGSSSWTTPDGTVMKDAGPTITNPLGGPGGPLVLDGGFISTLFLDGGFIGGPGTGFDAGPTKDAGVDAGFLGGLLGGDSGFIGGFAGGTAAAGGGLGYDSGVLGGLGGLLGGTTAGGTVAGTTAGGTFSGAIAGTTATAGGLFSGLGDGGLIAGSGGSFAGTGAAY